MSIMADCFITTQIQKELTTAYSQGYVSYRIIPRWIYRFSNEQESLKHNPQSGRSITVITQQNIDAVKVLVNDDPHINIDSIATTSDMVYHMCSCDECLKRLVKNLPKKRSS
ncbi:unnamed protein product [Rotaria sordida]|uniref:Uncharacterized protein n=1 Tax=Rotaria sordida TaxID=392033 RepID=A0A815FBA9_9BILA|nr:unnamed protein product [Rotaria sordida]